MTDCKIIAVNRFYWPDESATSQLLSDVVKHVAAEGETVEVVAGRRARNGGLLPRAERREGAMIHRVRMSSLGRYSLVGRAIDYLTFYVSASLCLLRHVSKGDRLLVKTDPPLMSVPASIVASLKGAHLYLWHQDLFPEAAEAVGVIRRNGLLGRLARWLRNRSLQRAETHVAISEGMAEQLTRQGVDPDRIAVIPNWSDRALAPVPPSGNPLRSRWDLEDRFVIGYSGNLGRAHQAEKLAELVRQTGDLPGVVWLFVGGGVGLHRIEALQQEMGIDRLRILPAQPRSILSYSLSVPDLHVVSLASACEGLIMPSKLYGAMAVGRPTLNFGDPDGAVARELRQHGAGLTISPEQPEEWRPTIERLLHDRSELVEMGRRARSAYERGYRPEHRLASWRRLLTSSTPASADTVWSGAEDLEGVR